MRIKWWHLSSWAFIIILGITVSCNKGNVNESNERSDCNSIYYWKTKFILTDYDLSFLKAHNVHRMYVKFFDVDDDAPSQYVDAKRILPVATTVFSSPKPDDVEIIPTVYLTIRAISFMGQSENGVQDAASKIVTRVLNMADYNDMGPIHEVQLDCDWTETTQGTYFSLCKEVSTLLHEKGIALSSTIRLHQLRTDVPPVDRGVLMLYNTGNLQKASENNSIISTQDVATYIKNRHIKYDIPLDFAYPTYSWGLVFWGNYFEGILHQSDYSDASLYSKQDDGSYLVKTYHEVDGQTLYSGERIRFEDSPIDSILDVKALVKEAFPDVPHNNIIYHLDSLNLSKYSTDEIKSIFND